MAPQFGFSLLESRQNAPPSLAPPGTVINLVDPASIGYRVIVADTILGALGLAFVAARLIVKKRVAGGWSWDDLFITLAIILAWGRIVVFNVDANDWGLGVHVWDFAVTTKGTTQKNLLFVGDMLYLLAIMCTKLSILLLYLSIWRVVKRFRYFCYAMMALVVTYCLIFFFLYAFGCNPVAKGWHTLDPYWLMHPEVGSCIDNIKVNYAIGGVNVVTDFILLVMPIPLVLRLNMSRKQKFGVLAVFATGAIALGTSIARAIVVVQTLKDADQTYVVVPEVILLTTELIVGIICACLPPLGPLYKRFKLHKLVPSSVRSLLSGRHSRNTDGAMGHSDSSRSRSRSRRTGDGKTLSQSSQEVVHVDVELEVTTERTGNTKHPDPYAIPN